MKTSGLPYEEAAEQRTVTAWVCKTCNRFAPDERIARYCCATTINCDTCGQPKPKNSWCKPCHRKSRDEKYEKMPQVEWDGETPLCMYDNDEFFFDADSIAEYIAEDPERTLEGLQLVLCEQCKPRSFEANDYWSDDLGEDGEIDGARQLDNYVNNWIKDHFPKMWYPKFVRPTLESLKSHLSMESV